MSPSWIWACRPGLEVLRHRATGGNVVRLHGLLPVAGLDLDEEAQTVRTVVTGATVDLTGTEFRLLRYFMQHPSRVLFKSRLAEHVYDSNTERDSNVLEVYINRLLRVREWVLPSGDLSTWASQSVENNSS